LSALFLFLGAAAFAAVGRENVLLFDMIYLVLNDEIR
jgi:hypothetical protein